MASFTKRGKTWQYTISNKGKLIRKGGFALKKDAQKEAYEIEMKLKQGKNVSTREISFADYFEDWWQLYKSKHSLATISHYKATAATIREYFGQRDIRTITRSDYQAFLNKYGETRARNTVEKLFIQIRGCVKDAIVDGVLETDFTYKAKMTGKEMVKRGEVNHLSFEESQDMIKYILPRLDEAITYYLILLGLQTGLRYEELVGLQWRDFNFFDSTIKVERAWGYSNRMLLGENKLKNKASYRTITIDQKTMKIFRTLQEKQMKNKLLDLERLVFFSPSSKYRVISNNAVNKMLRNIAKAINSNVITAHGLRHTHASILIYKKRSLPYISKRLGHEDQQTTIQYYSHVIKEMQIEDDRESSNIFESLYNV